MVKNTHGGSKHKSFAKKHSNSGGNGSLRMPDNPLELFAYVSVCHGNHFEAITLQYPKINTFIRNKFSKHNKFSNTVVRGAIVLIGLREWESPNFKNADLLEVFSQNDISLLLNIPSTNIHLLLLSAQPNHSHDDILFHNNDDDTNQLDTHNPDPSFNNPIPQPHLDFNFDDI